MSRPKLFKTTAFDHSATHPLRVVSDELCLAHDSAYVQGVLRRRIKNGFGNRSEKIAQSLPWTAGSFVQAAKYACDNRESTFSPTSGFHHAMHRRGRGYCTFNALTIAAILLQRNHGAVRIGILDLDSHPGDGTNETLRKTNSDQFVEHYSLGYERVNIDNNHEWLAGLPSLIESRFSNCDVLFYQSGMDSHIDDPYCDRGQFTTEQMTQREQMVFGTCRELGLPVVTNLAGGYQKPIERIVALHDLTARAFMESVKVPNHRKEL